MSIVRYLALEDYANWDKFVDMSPQGSFFCKSWWLEAATHGDFKICIVEGDGEILAGMPLPFIGKKKIKMPKLTQSLGVLFVDKPDIKRQKSLTNQKENTQKILSFISSDVSELDITFHHKYDYWLPFYWAGYYQSTRCTYLIEYHEFDEKVALSKLSKGHKWTVKKAEKDGILYKEIESLTAFYDFMKNTYERQGLRIGYGFEILSRFHAALVKNNAGKIFGAYDKEGILHAMCYIVYDAGEAYYWLGASEFNYRNSGAHTYLIWKMVLFYKDYSERFNFGGSMIPHVEKNFRNFGADVVSYSHIFSRKSMFRRELKGLLPTSFVRFISRFVG
jgi:hypothetical protein